ncbi:MAG: hypothetical protein HY557_01615 [Euryarchaeota archaeon]|nr:hypothetical protein [Euryarchaeota archaeon]
MVLLVRYGELTLKSPYVRRQLEDRLAANVQDMLAADGVEGIVRTERGRFFVHTDDEPKALRALRRVFGVVSVSPAKEVPSALEALTPAAVASARDVLEPGLSFAIRARRSGQHPYTSQDLGRALGQAVRDAIPGVTVDLDAPDREIHVEVRGPKAYVFHVIVDGPGGLPLGSQGEVLAIAEDNAGMVATWLLMRRGCRARVAGQEPYSGALRRWNPRLQTVDVGSASELFGVAAEKGLPLVLPSRTDNAMQGDSKPFVLRPLSGLSNEEIEGFARRIRTS